MKATVKSTGEVLEFEPKSLPETMEVWQLCKEYIEAYTKLKDQLKPLIEAHASSNGTTEPVNGYIFRVSNVQRYNYDKSALRLAFDEDTLDLFLEPNKSAVDRYLKEHLEEMGGRSTELRQAMVPVGKPYQVIKAEKVVRTD